MKEVKEPIKSKVTTEEERRRVYKVGQGGTKENGPSQDSADTIDRGHTLHFYLINIWLLFMKKYSSDQDLLRFLCN